MCIPEKIRRLTSSKVRTAAGSWSSEGKFPIDAAFCESRRDKLPQDSFRRALITFINLEPL
jgi:hypothetical protein